MGKNKKKQKKLKKQLRKQGLIGRDEDGMPYVDIAYEFGEESEYDSPDEAPKDEAKQATLPEHDSHKDRIMDDLNGLIHIATSKEHQRTDPYRQGYTNGWVDALLWVLDEMDEASAKKVREELLSLYQANGTAKH